MTAAIAGTRTGDQGPLSTSLETFQRSFAVNTTSAFAAVKHAVGLWDNLPDVPSPTFIYGGNGFIVKPFTGGLDASVGKAASANLIQLLADEYQNRSYR